jgi:hypothetical protein
MLLTLMIRKTKGSELMNFFLITNLSSFGSNMFFILKLMDFENVALAKIIHIYMIKVMNA